MMKRLFLIACCAVGLGLNGLQATDSEAEISTGVDSPLGKKLQTVFGNVIGALEAKNDAALELATIEGFLAATLGADFNDAARESDTTDFFKMARIHYLLGQTGALMVEKSSRETIFRIINIASRIYEYGLEGPLAFLNKMLDATLPDICRDDILTSRAIAIRANNFYRPTEKQSTDPFENTELFASKVVQEQGLIPAILEGLTEKTGKPVTSIEEIFDFAEKMHKESAAAAVASADAPATMEEASPAKAKPKQPRKKKKAAA